MTVAAGRPHTVAVISAIRAEATARSSPLLVGQGERPAGSGWQGEPGRTKYIPYAIVYPFPGRPDGDLADPSRYLDYSVQVTCVGSTSEASEAAMDLAKAALVDRPLSVPDRFSYRGQLITDQPSTRDDDVAPPVHYSIIQVTWRTQAD